MITLGDLAADEFRSLLLDPSDPHYGWLDSTRLWPAVAGSQAFPIGSVFLAVVATDPATLLGYGTWQRIAEGQVLVGQDSGDPDFDVAEETGGAKTHQHAGVSAGTPAGSVDAHQSVSGTDFDAPTSAFQAKYADHAFTGKALASHQHPAASNVMSYLVVYFWKRTA